MYIYTGFYECFLLPLLISDVPLSWTKMDLLLIYEHLWHGELKNLNFVTDEEQKKVVQTQNINFMTAQGNQPENLKFKNKLGILLLYLLWYCE